MFCQWTCPWITILMPMNNYFDATPKKILSPFQKSRSAWLGSSVSCRCLPDVIRRKLLSDRVTVDCGKVLLLFLNGEVFWMFETYQKILVNLSLWRIHGLDHELVLILLLGDKVKRLQTHCKDRIKTARLENWDTKTNFKSSSSSCVIENDKFCQAGC